jgi:hypothetical protein
MVAWQRGIGNGLQLDKLLSSSREILQIPPELDMIVPTNVPTLIQTTSNPLV